MQKHANPWTFCDLNLLFSSLLGRFTVNGWWVRHLDCERMFGEGIARPWASFRYFPSTWEPWFLHFYSRMINPCDIYICTISSLTGDWDTLSIGHTLGKVGIDGMLQQRLPTWNLCLDMWVVSWRLWGCLIIMLTLWSGLLIVEAPLWGESIVLNMSYRGNGELTAQKEVTMLNWPGEK